MLAYRMAILRPLSLVALLLLGCSDDAAPGEPSGLTTGNAGQAGASQAGSGGSAGVAGETSAAGQAGAPGGQGGANDSAWSCVGSVSKPSSSSSTVTVRLPLLDLFTGQPRAGITVRTCSKLDVNCLSPLGEDAVTDSKGEATLTLLAPNFEGVFQLVASADVAASKVYLHPTSLADGVTLPAVRTISAGALRAAVEAGGAIYDPSRGTLFVDARDCLGAPGLGVSWTAPAKAPDTVTFYVRSGAPSRTATETDASGLGGFLLVPTGAQTIVSARGGQALPERKVYVGADVVTYAFVSPTP